MLNRIIEWIRNNKIFVRERKKNEPRALAVLIYHLGLSYRNARDALSELEPISHEAVREWYHRMKHLFPEPKPKERRAIAVDETKIKVKGKWNYLWAAIDVDNWEILGVWITEQRSCFEALVFLRKVLRMCTNKSFVYVDGCPWYPWALNRLGLQWASGSIKHLAQGILLSNGSEYSSKELKGSGSVFLIMLRERQHSLGVYRLLVCTISGGVKLTCSYL